MSLHNPDRYCDLIEPQYVYGYRTRVETSERRVGDAGTGRKYGVSDNAIRKWKRSYEKETENQKV